MSIFKNFRTKATQLVAGLCAIALCLAMNPVSAFAAEIPENLSDTAPVAVSDTTGSTNDVSPRSTDLSYIHGTLQPGQRVSDSFTLTKWLGTSFTMIGAASGGSGYLDINFESEAMQLYSGTSVVLTRGNSWPRGTYTYYVTNNTNQAINYTIKVYEV